jgi:hypothetical protein
MKIVETPESYYYDSRYDYEEPCYSDESSKKWLSHLEFMFDSWTETQPEWLDERYAEEGFPDDVLRQMEERFHEQEYDSIQEEYVEWLDRNSEVYYD